MLNQTKLRIKEILKKAPKITGSEGNANIFINIEPEGNTFHSPCDEYCTGCPFYDFEEGNMCKRGWDFECPKCSFVSRYTITIQGDLRDTTFDKTYKEISEFFNFLIKNDVTILMNSIRIENGPKFKSFSFDLY